MPYVSVVHRASCLDGFIFIANTMSELFIELTNQIFWDGYAQQLASENPQAFQTELAEFTNNYNS